MVFKLVLVCVLVGIAAGDKDAIKFAQCFEDLYKETLESGDLDLLDRFYTNDSTIAYDGNEYKGPQEMIEFYKNLRIAERRPNSIQGLALSDGNIIVLTTGEMEFGVPNNASVVVPFAQTFIVKEENGKFICIYEILYLDVNKIMGGNGTTILETIDTRARV